MCLAAFAFGVSRTYPMVFAANRDELHARPAAAAHWWTDCPQILGGRDLLAGGSWLAVDRRGRLAAVTNVPANRAATPLKSRGHLVRDYLRGCVPAAAYATALQREPAAYGAYNLLLFDGGAFHYVGDQAPARRLAPGTYAISNAPLGTAWPKVDFAADALGAALTADDPLGALFELLANRNAHAPADPADPAGRRARVFIRDERFGTRASTVVLVSGTGEVRFAERRFGRDGARTGGSDYRFKPAAADAPAATR